MRKGLFSRSPDSFNCLTVATYCFNQFEDGTFSAKGVKGCYEKITSLRDMEPGDIVCFKSSSRLKGILGYIRIVEVTGSNPVCSTIQTP